jgi:hypothetical protein
VRSHTVIWVDTYLARSLGIEQRQSWLRFWT